MKYKEILEARSNPSLNPKISLHEFLLKYKNNNKAYIHFSAINKVGYNPKASYDDTPQGIYAYKISDVWDLYDLDNINTYYDLEKKIPYVPFDIKYIFILQSTTTEITSDSYTKEMFSNDITKLKEIDPNIKIYSSNSIMLFNLLKTLNGYKININTKTKLLMKLGYKIITDKGSDAIHQNEPYQTIFLTPDSYNVIDKFDFSGNYDLYTQFSKYQDIKLLSKIYKHNPWLKNADFINAIIELDENNNIIWKAGYWKNGTWENGYWEYGTWYKGTWKEGTWYDGRWINGKWLNGKWEDGTWEYGTWYKGTWKEGTWYDGYWTKGTWENGEWVKGEIWSDKQQKYIKSNVPPNEFTG